jgi:hypothetical protein
MNEGTFFDELAAQGPSQAGGGPRAVASARDHAAIASLEREETALRRAA